MNTNTIILNACNNNVRHAAIVTEAYELITNNGYTVAEALSTVGMTVNDKSMDIMDHIINRCNAYTTDISKNNDEAWGGRWAR